MTTSEMGCLPSHLFHRIAGFWYNKGGRKMKNLAIGVMDSGVGGVTVWSEIRRHLPGEPTIYYADSKNCPYGGRSYDQITLFAEKIVEELIARGVKLIVVACNTITAASITHLRAKYPHIPFVGMEPAVKPAARLTQSGVIGLLATRATLAGELYRSTLDNLNSAVRVIECAGVGLVELIESRQEQIPECETLLRDYLMPMLDQGADCLVLGCTHYPFLTGIINQITEGKLKIVNPAEAVARRVEFLLDKRELFSDKTEAIRLISIGAQLERIAKKEHLDKQINHKNSEKEQAIFLSSSGAAVAREIEKRALEFFECCTSR